MRSFQLVTIIIFLFIYILLSYLSAITLKKLFQTQKRKFFQIIYCCCSLLLILTFIFLYIYPNRPRDASNYSFYFYFNAILFIDFFSKIPISVAGIVSAFIKRSNTLIYIALIIASGLGLSIIYGLTLGNKQVQVSKIDIEYSDLPAGFNDYKIVQISDIHLGSFNKTSSVLKKAATRIEKAKPDLILFTGDLVNNFAYETDGWEAVFQKISSIAQSYSILGNHDYGNYTRWANDEAKTENLNKVVLSHSKFGFQILRNQNTVIKSGNDSIFLIGIENWGHAPFPQYADWEKASEGIPENAFTVLMSHDPAHWESQIKGKKNVNLTLSGHTHGLQSGIKIAGITFSLSYLTRKNWGGIYRYENTFLNVNTGLGMVGIPWRFDMPAEISLITLKRVEVDRE